MPFVNVVTEKKYSPDQQLALKIGIADVMDTVLGKEEKGLVITFTSADGFFRAGENAPDAAVLDIRYIGSYGLDKKQELTKKLCELMRDVLGCDPEKIIVPIAEMVSENWGRRFGNYQ
jgi:phenylpyruvate tautomerase PptA (4-oxalocrotonate tautomerase family)